MAHTLSALHRPGPLRPGVRPRHQLLRLAEAGAHPQLAQRLFGGADRHRRMRALVRINPDHHCRHEAASSHSLALIGETVAGTPNSRDPCLALAPLLSHATARPRQAGTSFESQAQRAGRRLKSQPTGTSRRYDPGSLPSRPGPRRLLTIRRISLVKRRAVQTTVRDGQTAVHRAGSPTVWA